MIVSHKNNVRILTPTRNHYQVLSDGKRETVTQAGRNMAVRRELHEATVHGLVDLPSSPTYTLKAALRQWEFIANTTVREAIAKLLKEGKSESDIMALAKKQKNKLDGIDVSKLRLLQTATRKPLDKTFDQKKIKTITDTGIQRILLAHLDRNGGNPELAFSPDGIAEMTKNMTSLNSGKAHKPIKAVRVTEPKGAKFRVGTSGNKSSKMVQAAKGANIYLAIYWNQEAHCRVAVEIALNEIVERLANKLPPVPALSPDGFALLFYLTPLDYVYIPTHDELEQGRMLPSNQMEPSRFERLWQLNNFSGHIYFKPNRVSSEIIQKEVDLSINQKTGNLQGSQILKATSFDDLRIWEVCIKLEVNRLGHITKVYE
jgi:CRISPR-associated endonuclease Csn1